jgi:uncharacterized membrane protein YeaQ/YmgE (transglycosylase-associated protein family)
MGIVAWIVIGLIAGWAASAFWRRTAGGDLVLSLLVGVVGAGVGGFITNLVIRQPVLGLNLPNFFVSVLAAVVFLAILAGVRRPA